MTAIKLAPLLFLYLVAFFRSVASIGIGPSTTCCSLALDHGAYLNGTIFSQPYHCGQTYASYLSPAPPLTVPYHWCHSNCPGFALTPPNATGIWANSLFNFIIPAVVFSLTVPRRLSLEPPKWCFEFDLAMLQGWIRAIASLVIAGLIVLMDTILWIFTIIVAAGPLIFSGLYEAVLDYNCIRHLEEATIPQGGDYPESLNRRERAQILISVLCGNLEIEGVSTKPRQELHEALELTTTPETAVRLRAILASQSSFGVTVGGPVLFYVGSFAYAISNLNDSKGDQGTARSLAFGIWWMCIVHVSIISGCLLASNNPSAAAAIVGREEEYYSLQQRLDLARTRSAWEDIAEAYLGALSRLPLAYQSRYEPVWMWARGKCKARWIRNTEAWEKRWFREKIEVNQWGWGGLIFATLVLVFLPCTLAFWIEFVTPKQGVGCRSLTILVYAVGQAIMVALTAWSDFKDSKETAYWTKCTWLNRLRNKDVAYAAAILVLIPVWFAVLFATLAGTLMQITGIYENCLCALSVGEWGNPDAVVTLSSDTEADRQSSSQWVRAGAGALASLTAITYLGWWSQRYLRETFLVRLEKFAQHSTQNPHVLADNSSVYDRNAGSSSHTTPVSSYTDDYTRVLDSAARRSVELSSLSKDPFLSSEYTE